ncbi:MAG: RNA 3'-phosphate cyclase [Candidatus Eisenbacteria bacterium]|nr:RNA 3'-phosphate cyclase [Candidatus Eisenbacteria bacterium]
MPERGPIEMDGSRGEGGGQLLRSALSVSAWRGIPFHMTRIRANRKERGLKAQHVAAVHATAQICGASVQGAERGSFELLFVPSTTQGGDYCFSIGTAGAATLVAQTLLPPLWAAGDATVRIVGGTHVPWSPSADYLRLVFARAVARLGFSLDVRVERLGFYPRGGGLLALRAGRTGRPAEMHWRRPPREGILLQATSLVSGGLSLSIAHRMLARARERLKAAGWRLDDEWVIEEKGSPGACLFLHATQRNPGSFRADGEEFLEGGFTGLGARGKPAEAVADEAVAEAIPFLESDASVDPRLADQLLVPALVAGSALRFRTSRVSGHLASNADLVQSMLGPCVEIREEGEVKIVSPPPV